MQFPSTHWSEVLAARDSPRSREALAALCSAYWAPLYAFIRRRGYDAPTAQDLAQDFFALFLEKDYLAVVAPEKGKFRSFLLKAVSHFLANEWDRRHAQKRGGGRLVLPLDVASAERQYGVEPAHDLTPEKIFEKRWALTLLEQVLASLHVEYARRKQTVLFERLKDFLTGDKTDRRLRASGCRARHDRCGVATGRSSSAATLWRIAAPRNRKNRGK